MPIRYVCSNCGYVLYDSSRDRDKWWWAAIPEPMLIAMHYGGRCPRCGKKLKLDITIDDVVVKR